LKSFLIQQKKESDYLTECRGELAKGLQSVHDSLSEVAALASRLREVLEVLEDAGIPGEGADTLDRIEAEEFELQEAREAVLARLQQAATVEEVEAMLREIADADERSQDLVYQLEELRARIGDAGVPELQSQVLSLLGQRTS